jgi:hypothetical protein
MMIFCAHSDPPTTLYHRSFSANLAESGEAKMEKNCFLKPAWTHNGSVRTDLPLLVFPKANKTKVAAAVRIGQLCCVGTVYLKTHDGLVKIR